MPLPVFPEMGVPRAIIHFHTIFPCKTSSYWGTPMTIEPPIVSFHCRIRLVDLVKAVLASSSPTPMEPEAKRPKQQTDPAPDVMMKFQATAKGFFHQNHMGVSNNGGLLKWMVYNGNILLKWMIWGYPHLWNPPYGFLFRRIWEAQFLR